MLLNEHGKEIPLEKTVPMAAARTVPRQPPVEPRPQLGRRIDHVEIDLSDLEESPLTKNWVIPEEFKTDVSLGIEPEFKFITSLDSIQDALNIKPHHRNRVEVIDLGDFATDDVSSHLIAPRFINPQDIMRTSFATKQHIERKVSPQSKKIEIIDARVFAQQTCQDVFLVAQKQNEEIEKKSRIYYLKAAGHKDTKITKKDEQSYVPDDFEERVKILREKQQQEEAQKRELEEKVRKQLEKEEQQKQELEEKVRQQLEKEQEKLAKQESKKMKTGEKKQKEEKIEQKKVELQPSNEVVTKKQLKEQQRLERIAARKTKIEERLEIKKEKKILKEQQKHLAFATSDKKGKYVPSNELDSDIKKILQITDALLGELPEEVINRFMQTDDFELYEHILSKYKIR